MKHGPLFVAATLALALAPIMSPAAASAATGPAVGDVLVADTGNNRVEDVTAGGQHDVGSGFTAPQGVTVDAAGNVFVADTGNNRVVEVPANGGPEVTVGSGFIAPTQVLSIQDGEILVVDSGDGGGEVVHMNEDGSDKGILTGNWSYGPPIAVASGGGHLWVLLSNGAIIQIVQTDYSQVSVYRDHDPSGGDDAGFVVDPFARQYQSDTVNNQIYDNGQGYSGTGLNDPEGLSLTADGDLVVADTGNNRVVEMAPNGSNQTTIGSGFSRPLGVAVYAPAPTFTADSPPTMLAGVPYSYTFKATALPGEPAPTFSYVTGGALPTNISLNDTTGILSGTFPGDPGIAAGNPEQAVFEVEAANGATATIVNVAFDVQATEFTASSPPSANVGVPYSYTFAAAGAAPISFTASLAGVDPTQTTTLPPGLTLDSASGVLSGTPTATGTWYFFLRASNSYGYTVCCSEPIQITVSPPVLTIGAMTARVLYGTTPMITPVYSGFVNGDTAAIVSGVTCSTAVDATTMPGNYTSTCSGGTAPGYTIVHVPGTITVVDPSGQGRAVASPSQVLEGAPGRTVTLRYTATRDTLGMLNGRLTVSPPSGWPAMSVRPTAPGFVTTTCGTVKATKTGVQIDGVTLDPGGTCTVTYGDRAQGGPGVTVPLATGTATFGVDERAAAVGTVHPLAAATALTVEARPLVTGLDSQSGPASGGIQVTVTGTGFVDGDTVVLGQGGGAQSGALPGRNVEVLSPTELVFKTPASSKAGPFHVFVIAPDGTASVATAADEYTFTP